MSTPPKFLLVNGLLPALRFWAGACVSCTHTHLGEAPRREMGNDPRQRKDEEARDERKGTQPRTDAAGTKTPGSRQTGMRRNGHLTGAGVLGTGGPLEGDGQLWAQG